MTSFCDGDDGGDGDGEGENGDGGGGDKEDREGWTRCWQFLFAALRLE